MIILKRTLESINMSRKRWIVPILLVSLSCCATKEERLLSAIGDYCLLYEPFPAITDRDSNKYWDIKEATITSKEAQGIALNGEEKLLKSFVNYAARNDDKFFKKGCGSGY